jgi:hypothetical protein
MSTWRRQAVTAWRRWRLGELCTGPSRGTTSKCVLLLSDDLSYVRIGTCLRAHTTRACRPMMLSAHGPACGRVLGMHWLRLNRSSQRCLTPNLLTANRQRKYLRSTRLARSSQTLNGGGAIDIVLLESVTPLPTHSRHCPS